MERGQCCCLASGGLPSTRPISSHFTHFPYVTGTLSAVALVQNPIVVGFAYVKDPAGPLNGVSQISSCFFHCPNPHWILQPEVMRIYLPSTGTLGCAVWPGARITPFQDIPPNFYLPRVNVEPPILPLPLCAIPSIHLSACFLVSTPPASLD